MRQCNAKGCDTIIKAYFCAVHWSMLPDRLIEDLTAEYQVGQMEDRSLATRKWNSLMEKARYLLKEEDYGS